MKKFIYFSAAALATLFATSCSSEDVPVPNDGDMTTFEVQLPDQLATRFGEGQQATKLYVAVYEKGTQNILFSNFAGEGNDKNAASLTITPFTTGEKPTCKVSVPLVKGKAYDLVFFAQDASSSAYSFDTAKQMMSVDYDQMANFDEARDAFFGQIKNFTSGGQGDSVTLTRPFSQINIGTADYQKYLKASGLTAQTFGMSISGVANTMNLFDGSVTVASADNTADVEVASPSPENTQLTVNGTSYDYLAMGYVLVGGGASTQATVNVNLVVGENTSFASYTSVPVQMNYRTNIFGDLLTNLENFNVTIDPIFAGKYDNAIPVASKEDLISAVKDGKNVVLNDNIELDNSFAQSIPAGKPVQVDLAGNDMTITATNNFTNKNVSFVNQSNEESNINLNANGNVIVAGTGSTVHVKNVNLTVADGRKPGSTSTAIRLGGDNANVIIEDCTITYYGYAFGTNANESWKNMTVTMKNVTVRPVEGSPVAAFGGFFNVPMTVNATDCYFEGINGGALMRGGTFNMTRCTFVQALFGESTTREQVETIRQQFCFDKDWLGGSGVPCAAITVGNRGSKAYQYPTNVTLTDCTLIVPEIAKNILPAMYVYANKGAGLGVNITMSGCKYNSMLEFGSTNIIYNGNAITEAVNYPANM